MRPQNAIPDLLAGTLAPRATWRHAGVRITETRDSRGRLWATVVSDGPGRELKPVSVLRGHLYWRGIPTGAVS